MKYYRLFLSFWLMVTSATSAAALYIHKGIHGMQWGSSIAEYDNLTKVHEKNQAAFYVNTQRRYHAASQPVARVSYGFYRDRFYAAFIKLQSKDQFTKLAKQFSAKHGNPKISYYEAGKQIVYRWQVADIRIKLKMKDSIREYKLAFYYLPLSAELNQNQLDQIPPSAYGPDPSDEKMNIKSTPLLDY